MKPLSSILKIVAVLCAAGAWSSQARAAAIPPVRVVDPYVFTDEPALVEFTARANGDVAYHVRLLTRAGLQPVVDLTGRVEQKHLLLKPLGEGIHIVTFDDGTEARFLAFDPPEHPLDPHELQKLLPRSASLLLGGEPLSLVALGDSVTATGEYPQILAKLLARSTGNRNITVEKRAHSGRSIDATVRSFDDEVAPLKPNLALLMYGLNDQAASTGLDVYLEQTRWIHTRLAALGSDLILLQPTPHIDPKASVTEPAYPLRTIGYAEALRPLARELNVPLVDTFNALWDSGHRPIPQAAQAMWALYPLSYSKVFTSVLETNGVGESIHPNALGHLQMARAVYDALLPPLPPRHAAQLAFSGQTQWEGNKLVSHIMAKNQSTQLLKGSIDFYPPSGAALEGTLQVEVNLQPGAAQEAELTWATVTGPGDLFDGGNEVRLVWQAPTVHALVTLDGVTRATAVASPIVGELHLKRGRSELPAGGTAVEVPVLDRQDQPKDRLTAPLPTDCDAAYVPQARLIDGSTLAAEIYAVRYAGALAGDAVVDGTIDEWTDQVWRKISLPPKQRGQPTTGPSISPAAMELQFTVKAGKDRFYVAMKSPHDLQGDILSLFFDPRSAADLGTIGPYFWLDAELLADGKVKLKPGETSPKNVDTTMLAGKWSREVQGGLPAAAVELAIPYSVMRTTAWPSSGDLGMEIVWSHRIPGQGKPSFQRQLWAENAHWWTPLGYGVVRLQEHADAASLPWTVRVR